MHCNKEGSGPHEKSGASALLTLTMFSWLWMRAGMYMMLPSYSSFYVESLIRGNQGRAGSPSINERNNREGFLHRGKCMFGRVRTVMGHTDRFDNRWLSKT